MDMGLDARALSKVKIAAVGEATARRLREYGVIADLVPQQFDGVHLAGALLDRTEPFDLVTLCGAAVGSEELEAALTAAGRTVRRISLYRTVPLPLREPELVEKSLRAGACVAFTSGSMVRSFAASLPGTDFSGVTAFCIGAKTAAAAEEAGFIPVVAEKGTFDGLVKKILGFFGES